METSIESTAIDKNTSLLASEIRDFFISPSGAQVKVAELSGATIGLYFAANWYPQCHTFTPILTNIYNQLKQNGTKFEVVFVSSDEDQSSFNDFFGTMPWLAIPFPDLQSKKGLTETFRIEGIPSLVILHPFGETICTEGVELIYRYGALAFPFTPERLEELEAEEEANHASQTLVKLLSSRNRDYVLDKDKQVPISSLMGKTVGLYFSAVWGIPCQKFTQKLVTVYNNLKDRKQDFEVVFISVDRDEMGYSECYGSMPWLALPYRDDTIKVLLKYFNVQGIPHLIIIGPDGKTVTREGRNLINLHLEMAFPFTESQLQLLQDKMDEEAKSYPIAYHHVRHVHVLNLVSAATGGGPFICCECDEQGSGWAYQCLDCGYEIHPKCAKEFGEDIKKKRVIMT